MISKTTQKVWITTWCLALSSQAVAKVSVVTSTTDLAWAAKEIGKGKVEVQSLLDGSENPHYVDASPDFIQKVAEAQIVCIVGLDLEMGWIPKVLEKAGNSDVQPGGRGYCETGKAIQVLEKPTGSVDRSMGDIHPSGNPHFWLSPKVFGEAAKVIADTLSKIDGKNARFYQKNYLELVANLGAIQERTLGKLRAVLAKQRKGPILMEYHKEFAYFLEAYGFQSFGTVEEKPGVLPSAGRLSTIAADAKQSKVRLVLGTKLSPIKTIKKFSELSKIPYTYTNVSIQTEGPVNSYEKLQNQIADSITSRVK